MTPGPSAAVGPHSGGSIVASASDPTGLHRPFQEAQRGRQPDDRDRGHGHDATGLLNFADVPSELSHLQFNPSAFSATSASRTGPSTITGASDAKTTTAATNSSTTTNASASRNAFDGSSFSLSNSTPTLTALAPSRPSSSSSSHQPPTSAIRKTSPGLAARLKALGFGTTTAAVAVTDKPASPTSLLPDNIGRLDSDQLRQLDRKHQAGSFSSVISRRGRPWKGASATSSPKLATAEPDLAVVSPPLLQLPEIRTPEPLAMDTQKYRLPDHTNGNGTKVTLDTRREHLERSTLPPSPDDVVSPPPPPPPPKETPPASTPSAVTTPPNSDYVPGLGSYFTPGHNRPGSIYTLSRASFANQLAQLTSLQLPDAESLSSRVSAIPTAQVAAKALINAADQIRSWIAKAMEVIGGLDSEDDVEWAAAGGREGLAEVENAISRFEELINVFVGAIEELQSREDISNVSSDDLKRAVSHMEGIIEEWSRIRETLNSVRGQVEIAMEWEELWNNVLGDIQGEMDELSRLVFEMEERRHKSIAAAANGEGVDIGDLETIVEETPAQGSRLQAPNRFSLPAFPMSPSSPGTPSLSQDDSSLLALFARMQPLRASLDFLPMRLSVFETRAESSFPTACEELEMRRDGLDASYKKLEKDAEVLRKELGEDRWVIVFRGAGRQAQKMHESVERSLAKLREAIDAGLQLSNPPTMVKKMESYEAKKTHYGPAIERVLSIIDRGVKDRLTVNGEILRLHSDLQARWESLKIQTRDMDAIVEDIQADRKSQALRDSISSMLSNDRSTVGSGRDTPGSSPPSSVIMSSLGFDPHTPSTKQAKTRSSSVNSNAAQASNRRHSSLPTPNPQLAKKTGSRLSTIPSSSATTPVPGSRVQRPGSTLGHRPAWNGSAHPSKVDTGHNFKPLNLTTPSPYAKRSPNTQRSVSSLTPSSGASKLGVPRSPLARATSDSPKQDDTPSRPSHSRLSFRERLASPGPYAQHTLSKTRLAAQNSMATISGDRRASLQQSKSDPTGGGKQPSRPSSSLASTSRRSSLLPQPKGAEPKDNKPRWRH